MHSEELPWCPDHQQTNMVQVHQDSYEEGTTQPIPSQETEKICHGSPEANSGLTGS